MSFMDRRKKGNAGSFSREKASIPGTYKIQITREGKTGKQVCFTAYVPTSFQGIKELVKRQFEGVPGKRPEYFMKSEELRRF